MTKLYLVFAAIGEPTRLAIVDRLMSEGPLSAGELQDVADISAPAISRHLKVLREAGLVSQTVDRQRRIYAVRPETLGLIDNWLAENKANWA